MRNLCFLMVAFYFLNLGYSDGLRCWVCGGNNKPYSTNPNHQNAAKKGQKNRPSKDEVETQESGDESAEPESLRSKRGTGEGVERKKGSEGPPAFCTNSVVNMTCKQQYPTQKLLCYKEKWTVDGTTMVKRGCAVEDSRYNLTGCEEQIAGPGGFDILLCLCNEPMCNSTHSNHNNLLIYILIYAMIVLLISLI